MHVLSVLSVGEMMRAREAARPPGKTRLPQMRTMVLLMLRLFRVRCM